MNIVTEFELLNFIKKHLEEDYAKSSKLEIKNTTMIDSDILIEADVIK